MFFNIINLIRLNVIKRKKILIINNNNKKINLFLKNFIKLNLIKFSIKKKNKIILVINILKNNKLLFKLKNLYLNSNLKKIKYHNIKKINEKNIIIYITSNKGIINNYEAKNKKIGGILLFQIWN
jgi:ribosomal protein S8